MRQKVNNQTSQQIKAVSNLGGPTSNILANDKKAVNLEWAKKYVKLNWGDIND